MLAFYVVYGTNGKISLQISIFERMQIVLGRRSKMTFVKKLSYPTCPPLTYLNLTLTYRALLYHSIAIL